MDLIGQWREKYATGKVRYDPHLLEIRALAGSDTIYPWGTLLYSEAREQYKTRITGDKGQPSFDLDLMQELEISRYGGLIVAANPNSLFEGHSVIYPQTKSHLLTHQDLTEITRFAVEQPDHTFIHNMENSAASILDWAHFQSYPIIFPIESELAEMLGDSKHIRISRISGGFPAYALVAQFDDADAVSSWIFQVLELLFQNQNPHGRRIPVNLIWRSNRVWVVPRSSNQSSLAARYFGGLEMGGIFCLPNADQFRSYLPSVLKQEIVAATLSSEAETRVWFEENALSMLRTEA